MSTNSAAPPLKRGWLKKQARSGLVKNWQIRYFVLNQGKISYYQEQLDRFPYGDILKGELELFDATISKDIKKFSDKQIYIVSRKGQKDLLMESDTEKDARDWTDAIQAHIDYANSTFTGDNAPTQRNSASNNGKLDRSSTSMMDDRSPSLPSFASLPRKDSTGGAGRDSEDGTDAPSASTFVITPKPAWVVKILRTNGEKIFINLCEHPDIPMMQLALNLGFNKWPFMILTPARTIQEDKEDGNVEVSIYDAVVNPAVVNICAKDPQAKDATCLRIMRLLKKKFGEDLQLEYKLPKINKKYKGDVQQVLVPSNISSLAKSRSSVHVQVASASSIASAVGMIPNLSQPSADAESAALKSTARSDPQFTLQRKLTEPMTGSSMSGGQPKPTRRSTMTKLFPNLEDSAGGSSSNNGNLSPNSPPPTLQRTYTEVPYNTVSSVRAGAQRRSMRTSFVNPVVDKNAFKTSAAGGPGADVRKVVVPYIIVRSNGITAKSRPDKSSTGKILGHGVKVFVVARKVMPDHIAWLRTTEGWIMEKVFAGTIHRVATPCLYGQPTTAKIINTRFEEHGTGVGLRSSHGGDNTNRASNGWFSFRASALEEMFQTRFNIEIMHQDNAILRISRTFSEVLTLRAMLLAFNDKALKDRTLKAGEFPIMHDGENDLFADVHLLIEVVESVETWFTKLFSTVQVERCKCKALKEFLTPKESDYHLMEVELMADGGICGGWAAEIEEDLASMGVTE